VVLEGNRKREDAKNYPYTYCFPQIMALPFLTEP